MDGRKENLRKVKWSQIIQQVSSKSPEMEACLGTGMPDDVLGRGSHLCLQTPPPPSSSLLPPSLGPQAA